MLPTDSGEQISVRPRSEQALETWVFLSLERHRHSFGTAAETERLLRAYSKSWYETEPEQAAGAKNKGKYKFNRVHRRIAPATRPEGFPVSKAVVEGLVV